ncbi:MAG TPA: hypothetical protein VG346_03430 [Acidimicrobiales bacterium]|jgi:hypothetical protein|nr:hypothetical protein [Acidimicrobiales bacterium]
MVALVVVVTFVALVLSFLVAGLLRSHADILRSLHELGVGVGDPAGVDGPMRSHDDAPQPPTRSHNQTDLPSSHTVAGVTPEGDARAIAMSNHDGFTLLAFLSSGCATCAGFWEALQNPDGLGLPRGTRVVIVTKGQDREIPYEVAALTTGRVPVVMSTDAWLDYQVPGSPFFVLVDGAANITVGQGVAAQVGQLLDLIRRAEHDRAPRLDGRQRPSGSRNGPQREADADEVLSMAGIHPGDPSLYPQSLTDVFPFGGASNVQVTGTNGGPMDRAK